MRTITLQRLETSDEGTFGVISVGGVRLFSGELPWREDENDVSCIPAGSYTCVMTYSSHFKRKLYAVTGDVKRSGVRIHPANLVGDRTKGYVSQLLGCIALGLKMGRIRNQKAILVSQTAVRKFQKFLNDEPFILEIKDARVSS